MFCAGLLGEKEISAFSICFHVEGFVWMVIFIVLILFSLFTFRSLTLLVYYERTNQVYLPMNGVNNDWLPVEAEAHQSWPPKKLTN